MAENTTVEDLKAPLLAAVGAADLALATVNEILSTLRERAELAGDRMDDRRAVLTRLQEELPKRTGELRGKLSTEELRKAADEFLDDATVTYNSLVERGGAALERLMGQPEFKEAAGRVETYVDQAVELTQEALGNVSAQTRAVGERAAKLVGVDLPAKKSPAKALKKAVKTVAKKAPAKKAVKKAPAKKAAAKKAPVKKAAAKKSPAKAAKKVAKKAQAKRVTQK
jgi:heparin binding hemagglutinin HbhA